MKYGKYHQNIKHIFKKTKCDAPKLNSNSESALSNYPEKAKNFSKADEQLVTGKRSELSSSADSR